MSGTRVLVTGSTGLIGAALVRSSLDERFEIHGVGRSVAPHHRVHRADLSNPEDVHDLLDRVRPTVIVHLAGSREGDMVLLYESNVLTTVNLMQVAARMQARPAFITAGSAAEYGEPDSGIASESSPMCPITEYGRAKVAATALARALARSSGMRLCIVRPFNVVSPRLPAASALGNMRQQLLEQEGKTRVVRCGRLDVVRDFIPLDFVTGALWRLLDTDEWPDSLNLCSGIGIELGSILRAMGDHLDVDIDVVEVPKLATIPAARRIVGDPSRLRSLGLDCSPTASTLAQTMIETGRSSAADGTRAVKGTH
jgi:nucleoside-diphosphate-sugar epimerase